MVASCDWIARVQKMLARSVS